jgi:hypothetical protein
MRRVRAESRRKGGTYAVRREPSAVRTSAASLSRSGRSSSKGTVSRRESFTAQSSKSSALNFTKQELL